MRHRPPILMTITPTTGMLRRYVGRKCTHVAELTEQLNRSLLQHLYDFMLYPDHPVNYEPDPPSPPRVA